MTTMILLGGLVFVIYCSVNQSSAEVIEEVNQGENGEPEKRTAARARSVLFKHVRDDNVEIVEHGHLPGGGYYVDAIDNRGNEYNYFSDGAKE